MCTSTVSYLVPGKEYQGTRYILGLQFSYNSSSLHSWYVVSIQQNLLIFLHVAPQTARKTTVTFLLCFVLVLFLLLILSVCTCFYCFYLIRMHATYIACVRTWWWRCGICQCGNCQRQMLNILLYSYSFVVSGKKETEDCVETDQFCSCSFECYGLYISCCA